MMQELKLAASDNTELFVHSWCVNEPKAVILLAHGMAEHSMRYAEFAEFLMPTESIFIATISVAMAKVPMAVWDICAKGWTGS